MTREAYNKHKDVMAWFYAEEGRTVLRNAFKDKSVWTKLDNPSWNIDYDIIPNDEHVEFRKAIVEGKTVVATHKTIINTVAITEQSQFGGKYLHSYRIKPEEPKFKVGQWVRYVQSSTEEHHIGQFEKFEQNIITCTGKEQVDISENTLELWEPQEGDIVIYIGDYPDCVTITKWDGSVSFCIREYIPYIGQSYEEME